jgi:hypothetical protein
MIIFSLRPLRLCGFASKVFIFYDEQLTDNRCAQSGASAA